MTSNHNATAPTYVGFWPRVAAGCLDTVILSMLVFPVLYYNIITLKSPYLYLCYTLVGVLYKPFMEYLWGATVGKFAAGIRSVDYEGGRLSFFQAMLRNIFPIGIALVQIPIYFLSFYQEPIVGLTDVFKYTEVMNELYPLLQYVAMSDSLLFFADIIRLIYDDKHQAWHDVIAKTYVIRVN